MAHPESVILYLHRRSPFAQRVHLAVAAKGIAVEPVHVDFDNKPLGLLEANPMYGTVPTLVHNGNPICESLVILEYLEEAWPHAPPLMPKECVARAKARFWADYMCKGFEKLLNMMWTEPHTPERDVATAELPRFFKILEETMRECSAEGPFFTGDQLGFLDVILSPLACWGQVLQQIQAPIPSPEEIPRVHKYIRAIRDHEAYKRAIPSDEEMVGYFNEIMEKVRASK